jgi:hypothetical protein
MDGYTSQLLGTIQLKLAIITISRKSSECP